MFIESGLISARPASGCHHRPCPALQSSDLIRNPHNISRLGCRPPRCDNLLLHLFSSKSYIDTIQIFIPDTRFPSQQIKVQVYTTGLCLPCIGPTTKSNINNLGNLGAPGVFGQCSRECLKFSWHMSSIYLHKDEVEPLTRRRRVS